MLKRAAYCITCIVCIGGLGLLGCSVDGSSETDTQISEFLQGGSVSPTETAGASEGADAPPGAIAAEEPPPPPPPAPAPQTSSSGVTSAGFLWKPISESDGNLVVLLPSALRGKVSQTSVVNSSGQVIETGRFAGDTHNGNRPHYRFSMPGAGFGRNVTVVARLTDGSVRTWGISNGGSRVEA